MPYDILKPMKDPEARKETYLAHGCFSAGVVAKYSSVVIQSKYKTPFWEGESDDD